MYQVISTSRVEGDHGRLRSRQLRRRLSGLLFNILGGSEEVVVVGPDPLLAHYTRVEGLDPESLATCQILIDDTPVTVVGVPNAIWYGSDMLCVHRVKQAMFGSGRMCILLPQRALEGGLGKHSEPISECGPHILVQVIRMAPFLREIDACRHGRGHDPAGCLAVQLATGTPCLG